MNLRCESCDTHYRYAEDGTTEFLRTEKRSQFAPALSEWVPMPGQLFALNFALVRTLEGDYDHWCRCCVLEFTLPDDNGVQREF